jgi:hypothetical protein
MATKWWTEAELTKMFAAAKRRTDRDRAKKRYAVAAHYDARTGKVMVELANGAVFGFPAEVFPDLAYATASELAEVEVSPGGWGLLWDNLNASYDVYGLQEWIFDKHAPMKELGRAGGRSKSAAKARAARRNGALGGRPRGSTNGKRIAKKRVARR